MSAAANASPYIYVTSLQYELKNARYKLLTGEYDVEDRCFFLTFALCSLEIVKFILYESALQNQRASHPLSKDQLCSLVHFQNRNWLLVDQLSSDLVWEGSKTFFDHIDQVWEILCMWERFIAINKIKCFL